MIIIPKFKDTSIEIPRSRFGVKGRYRIVATSPRYKGERVLAEFDNLILDGGLDRLGVDGVTDVFRYCRLGSGNTAPNVGQTTLTAQFAFVQGPNDGAGYAAFVTNTYIPGPPPRMECRIQYRFPEGTATGTIAEVGVGWTTSGSGLFSRALIVDGGGSPTTLTILSDETLDVFYTVSLYPPTADVIGTGVVIGGTPYNYVARYSRISSTQYFDPFCLSRNAFSNTNLNAPVLCGIYPSTSVIGSITGEPSGLITQFDTITPQTYTNGSFNRTIEYVAGLTRNPAGGVKCVNFMPSRNILSLTSGCNNFQMEFNNPIPKNGTTVLTLRANWAWARGV